MAKTQAEIQAEIDALQFSYFGGTVAGDTVQILTDLNNNAGGNVVTLVTMTKAQADTAIAGATLTPGQNYMITDADSTLYGGTSILLRAFSTTAFEERGHGVFYNPKYNQAAADFGIWNNLSSWTATVTSGTFKGNENVTANNGAVGQIFGTIDGNKFIVTSGDFTTATSITGSSSGATANIASVSVKSYAIGSSVIWGGKVWTNVNGNVGASTNSLTLNAEWTVIPYDSTNYNVIIDEIEYDYANDLIVSRSDVNGNIVVNTKNEVTTWSSLRVIALFQWGNPYSDVSLKGCGNNKIINGYADCVNNIGCFANNDVAQKSYFSSNRTYNAKFLANRLRGGAYIASNTLINSSINNNDLSQGNNDNAFTPCAISSNILGGSSFIHSNILKAASTINSNTLSGGAYIYNNSLSYASAINSNILTGGSEIFANVSIYQSNINSNTLSNSYIYINKLSDKSYINSNTGTNNGNIRENILEQNSNMNSNNLSNYSVIWYNRLNHGNISSNTVNNGNATYFTYIYNNELINTPYEGIISNTVSSAGYIACCHLNGDNLYGGSSYIPTLSGFNITGNGGSSSAGVSGIYLKSSILKNAILTGTTQMSNLDILLYIYDYASATVSSNIQYAKIYPTNISYDFKVTFTGASGVGAIGSVTIPNLQIPTGFFISEALISASGLTGTGAKINLGIATDAPTAALNDTTGDIATLNSAGITKISPSTFTKATAARTLVLTVNTANITAGTLSVNITLKKFT